MVLEWWCEGSPYKDKDGIICDGSIRAGKTTAMAFSYIMWAMDSFDEENFALCGKTINSLRRNVIKQLLRILRSRGYTVAEHRAENYITITLGDVKNDFYLFGGKDEASQDLIQGITLAGVFFDEVALMPESFVNQAIGRCSVDGAKFWFNCNPDRPSHWFKEEWIDKLTEKNVIRIHFKMEDNPSLSKKIIERYKKLFTGVFYQRFIEGLWVMAEGLIYPMYEDALVEDMPKNPDGTYKKSEKTILSLDYGTMNAFAAMQWDLIEGVWYSSNCYYYSGRDTGIQKTDMEYLEDLEKTFEPLITDLKKRMENAREHFQMPPEKITIIIDPSAASFIALLKKQWWCKVRSADNDVIDGIRDTASALQLGLIKIVNNKAMKPWKKEVGGYVWDDTEKEDRPVKVDDHCLTGDTLVDTEEGQIPISELVGKTGHVWSYRKGKAILKPFYDVRMTQKDATIFRITLEDGRTIECTGEHPILTQRGWIEAQDLLTSVDKIVDISPSIRYNRAFNVVGIKKIEIIGTDDVYNMEVKGTHCFSINGGLIVHNCMDSMRYFVFTMRLIRKKMKQESRERRYGGML